MTDVEQLDDPVVREVTWWLSRDDFGLISAVARLVGVTPTSVSAWALGTTRPTPRHWPKLEEAFGQKAGHLGRIASGAIEPRTTPVEVVVRRPPSMQRQTESGLSAPRSNQFDEVWLHIQAVATLIEREREERCADTDELSNTIATMKADLSAIRELLQGGGATKEQFAVAADARGARAPKAAGRRVNRPQPDVAETG